jgi:hypothetical protein
MDNLCSLPIDIIQLIASFLTVVDLPNLFRVSKFFNHLEFRLSTHLSLIYQSQPKTFHIRYEDLQRLLKRMPNVKTLDLSFHRSQDLGVTNEFYRMLESEYKTCRIRSLLLNDCTNFPLDKRMYILPPGDIDSITSC